MLYIYHDRDKGNVEVFNSLKDAEAYTIKQWGEPKWTVSKCYDGSVFCWHDVNSGYVSIYPRETFL